jgi:hypothetical protein
VLLFPVMSFFIPVFVLIVSLHILSSSDFLAACLR